MITITLTVKDNNETDPRTTEIDCSVKPEEPSLTEAQVSNIINNAARMAFEDYLKGNPGGGHIIQRARKGGPDERGIKPKGF